MLCTVGSTLALAACGGSDSTPAVQNTAPSFTSSTTASVAENPAGPVYQAAATDAQGDPITYSISGGADASAFSLSGGSLSFVTPPNYDLPGDTDGNNVYDVKLTASDGKLSATLALSITVTNDREGISVTRIATGLTEPVGITGLGNGSELAIAVKDGTVYKVTGATGAVSQYYRFADLSGNPFPGFTLLGITRAAAFPQTQGTYALTKQNGTASIICIDCSIRGTQAIAGSVDSETLAIGTGPDGAAYVAIGDVAGTAAQDSSSRLGKLYRVDPNRDPYAGTSITYYIITQYGQGLRMPAGIAALPNGVLAIADRGASVFDELSIANPTTGLNYGWPYFEGTKEVNAGGSALSGLVVPALALPLGDQFRQSRGIVGGAAYTGSIPGIANQYVFADKGGRIWSMPLSKFVIGDALNTDALEVRDEDFKPDAGVIDQPVGMALDANGTLYILDGDGELFRVSAT
ncbi:MAG: PQQ-dependent sugar dehydrogenase [Novosphingobium sp.]